jgi:hypothetical protein
MKILLILFSKKANVNGWGHKLSAPNQYLTLRCNNEAIALKLQILDSILLQLFFTFVAA